MFLPEIKSKLNEDISILIKLDNHSESYLCDCGDASLLTVKDCQSLTAIFISHTHIDHFINFDTILRHQLGTGKKVIICGPKGITKQVQARIKGYSWNLINTKSINYEIREIITEQLIQRSLIQPPNWSIQPLKPILEQPLCQNKKFEVHFTILDHKIPSIAYRFIELDTIKIDLSNTSLKGGPWVSALKNAYKNETLNQPIEIGGAIHLAKDFFHLLSIKKGDTLGIIMDHAASVDNHQKIYEHFQNFNKVFIETYHLAKDKAQADLNFHSFTYASGEIMRKCMVKQVFPVHFSRRYDEQEILQLIEEFNKAFEGNLDN